MSLDSIIRTSAFPADTSNQVKMVTEDFRKFLELFDQKNREYGSENAFVLGSAGQFADIWRKIGKLKTALWDKKPEQLTSEGTEEIIQDLIGHLFLTLQCLRKENSGPSVNFVANPSFVESSKGWIDGTTTGVDEMISAKRAKVLELYPQIGRGSLLARNEESLDWLISAAKPVSAFQVGDKVDNHNDGGFVSGKTGTILSVDASGVHLGNKIWYQVDFGPGASRVTCSEGTLRKHEGDK